VAENVMAWVEWDPDNTKTVHYIKHGDKAQIKLEFSDGMALMITKDGESVVVGEEETS